MTNWKDKLLEDYFKWRERNWKEIKDLDTNEKINKYLENDRARTEGQQLDSDNTDGE